MFDQPSDSCGQFAFQRQRVACRARTRQPWINILHANLNRERVGAARAGCRTITVCTAFRENPLLEVPAGEFMLR